MFSYPDCEAASNVAQANSEDLQDKETTLSTIRLRKAPARQEAPASAEARACESASSANFNPPKGSVPGADDSVGLLLPRFGYHPLRPGARKSQPRTPISNLPQGVARH